MKKIAQELLWLLTGVFLFLLLPGVTEAAALSVNCNGPAGTLNTVGAALRKLNAAGPNTINVSGNCKENVVIQGFGRLTLNALGGASITDASGGTGVVVDIEDSTDVTLNGFTISGGDINVLCGDFSVCRFQHNTIQGAVGDGTGVHVARSRASFDGDIVQDNAGRGLNFVNGSTVLATNIRVNNNQAAGVFVGFGSFLVADQVNIQNNAANGVRVISHSTFRLVAGVITGNGANGVGLEQASEAAFQSFDGPINIFNNAGNGVRIQDLSFAFFLTGDPPLNVKGNSAGVDVACNPQFSATRGALTNIGGGTTNCTEP